MKVLALLGTYHEGGSMDLLADAVLEGAGSAGAKTEKIHLADLGIQYCRNCQNCWERPELKLGKCPIDDDVASVLRKITRCDALVLGTAINYGWPTGVTKVFMERMGPLYRRRGGPGVIGRIPTPRLSKDEGPTKGAAIVTCYGTSFGPLPFGDAQPGFKILKEMLKSANVKDVELLSGAWQVMDAFPISRRHHLLTKARKTGRQLATS